MKLKVNNKNAVIRKFRITEKYKDMVKMDNPNFKVVEFDHFKALIQSLKTFTLK